MIDIERLTRAIASSLCRDGYIDVEGRDGCRFLEEGVDRQSIGHIAVSIAREYEQDNPRSHPHDDEAAR